MPLVETRLGATASLVAEVHHAYAQALHLMGREEEALAHAETADRIYAVSRPPEHFSRLWLLALWGNIQREAGDLPSAITSHERLLALASGGPDQPATLAPEILLAIGETFAAAGRQGEAESFSRRLSKSPRRRMPGRWRSSVSLSPGFSGPTIRRGPATWQRLEVRPRPRPPALPAVQRPGECLAA